MHLQAHTVGDRAAVHVPGTALADLEDMRPPIARRRGRLTVSDFTAMSKYATISDIVMFTLETLSI